jgi:hypothetical protein
MRLTQQDDTGIGYHPGLQFRLRNIFLATPTQRGIKSGVPEVNCSLTRAGTSERHLKSGKTKTVSWCLHEILNDGSRSE